MLLIRDEGLTAQLSGRWIKWHPIPTLQGCKHTWFHHPFLFLYGLLWLPVNGIYTWPSIHKPFGAHVVCCNVTSLSQLSFSSLLLILWLPRARQLLRLERKEGCTRGGRDGLAEINILTHTHQEGTERKLSESTTEIKRHDKWMSRGRVVQSILMRVAWET